MVVTHHLPHPRSIHPSFANDPLTPAFCSDLTEMVEGSDAALWVHGHTHSSSDYIAGGIWQESRFNPMAVSPAGAAGLAQLMPATARYLGVENRHDPLASIDGGARYLKEMLDRFEAVHLALAAYNAGPGAVARRGTIPRNGETPAYVNAVLKRWNAVGS